MHSSRGWIQSGLGGFCLETCTLCSFNRSSFTGLVLYACRPLCASRRLGALSLPLSAARLQCSSGEQSLGCRRQCLRQWSRRRRRRPAHQCRASQVLRPLWCSSQWRQLMMQPHPRPHHAQRRRCTCLWSSLSTSQRPSSRSSSSSQFRWSGQGQQHLLLPHGHPRRAASLSCSSRQGGGASLSSSPQPSSQRPSNHLQLLPLRRLQLLLRPRLQPRRPRRPSRPAWSNLGRPGGRCCRAYQMLQRPSRDQPAMSQQGSAVGRQLARQLSARASALRAVLCARQRHLQQYLRTL